MCVCATKSLSTSNITSYVEAVIGVTPGVGAVASAGPWVNAGSGVVKLSGVIVMTALYYGNE